MDRGCLGRRHGVVRPVRGEIERWDALEPSARVEVATFDQRLELFRSLNGGWTQSVLVVNGHTQTLHHRSRVLTEALLARHQRVAVMGVFHCPLLQIVGYADIVVGTENQTGAF